VRGPKPCPVEQRETTHISLLNSERLTQPSPPSQPSPPNHLLPTISSQPSPPNHLLPTISSQPSPPESSFLTLPRTPRPACLGPLLAAPFDCYTKWRTPLRRPLTNARTSSQIRDRSRLSFGLCIYNEPWERLRRGLRVGLLYKTCIDTERRSKCPLFLMNPTQPSGMWRLYIRSHRANEAAARPRV
jgi:hypothetical protein